MLDNAGFFMSLAVVFNLFARYQRFFISVVFLVTSLVLDQVLNLKAIHGGQHGFILIAFAEVCFIIICSSMNKNDEVITLIIGVSVVSLPVQLYGNFELIFF